MKGADAWCQKLATQAGAGDHTWRAYLSATDAKGKAINARDRIGKGPWFNAKGVQIASSLDDLHSEAALTGKANSLDEKGNPVKGRGDSPNQHDMMTGSLSDGRLAPPVAMPCPPMRRPEPPPPSRRRT
uniref:Uncharacterized protein n=1 Tax=Phenylobacterium glaciei TaxID=2803784 RepID=A0A974S705_9CAUL|nr:hypothetical protein JKL49_17565 [Phenylobacterium glaciei]